MSARMATELTEVNADARYWIPCRTAIVLMGATGVAAGGDLLCITLDSLL